MIQSRKQFTANLLKRGFKRYRRKGYLDALLAREYFKNHPFAVGLSRKGASIDVAIYDLESKRCDHFYKYADAFTFLVGLVERNTPKVLQDSARKKRNRKTKKAPEGVPFCS